MAVSKRLSTQEPLTEHDVAERLDKAALRLLHIMIDTRNLGIMKDVRESRYYTNVIDLLADEISTWRHTDG